MDFLCTIIIEFIGNYHRREGDRVMAVSYKRLWKLLIDKDMKKDLMREAHLSSYTINKLNRGDNVNIDTLVKICKALDCRV